MRLLVIGTGSIGMRHGRNLVALGQDVTAWDADPARLAGLAALPGVTRAASLEAGLAARPDAVVVCTPPATHVALARHSVEAGARVFVEKPIAPVSDEVPELIDLARRHGRVLIVGFNLRFLPSLAGSRPCSTPAGSAASTPCARSSASISRTGGPGATTATTTR